MSVTDVSTKTKLQMECQWPPPDNKPLAIISLGAADLHISKMKQI
jgi:hypothetical protein